MTVSFISLEIFHGQQIPKLRLLMSLPLVSLKFTTRLQCLKRRWNGRSWTFKGKNSELIGEDHAMFIKIRPFLLAVTNKHAHLFKKFSLMISVRTWEFLFQTQKEKNILEKVEIEGNPLEAYLPSSVLYGDTLIVFGGNNLKDQSSNMHQIRLGKYWVSDENIFLGPEIQIDNDEVVKDIHSFGSMLFSHQYSDIIFSVEKEQIPAHKIVLATRCKYFRNLFTSHSQIIFLHF